MKIITGLFISILFLTTAPSLTSAASCQCTLRATAERQPCEQISTSECYLKFTRDITCQAFTDNNCREPIPDPPPGLSWSKSECDKAEGEWIPPASGIAKGPYCFEKQTFETPYKLQIPLGGVTEIKDLGQYVATLYRLTIGLAVFFSIIATMIAGFLWLTSAGDAGKISRAKKMILNGIIGIILAAGSYTILQTINPQILKLQLPRILKIKTVNYVGAKGCSDYQTRPDCEKNPIGFNSGIAVFAPAGYSGTGCAWDGQSCVQAASPTAGTLGGLCIDKSCFGELKCVFTANVYVCTDGNQNSVCGRGQNNDGCGEGLKCDTSLASICYKPGENQPQGTPCDDNKQCASKICEGSRCAMPQCDPSKCPSGQVCLLNKTTQIQSCQKPPECGTHEVCQQTYDPSYYCPFKLYESYTDSLDAKYINVNYGPKTSADVRVCRAGYPNGKPCRFDEECVSNDCEGLDDTRSQLGACE